MKKYIIALLLSSCLTACGFFDKDNTPAPSPLVNFPQQANPQLLWSASVGRGVENEYLRLGPAVGDQAIFTANANGKVSATGKLSGDHLWSTNTKRDLSGSPGVGDGLVIVGTREGEVVALNQQNGKIAWTAQVSSEILAPIVISQHRVLIKSIDGKLTVFSTQGFRLWDYRQTEPVLILRASSAPQVSGNNVVAGFANGGLAKLTLNEGSLLWSQTIGVPQGSFAIQRMVDIDADPVIFNHRIYAATYQGSIAAVDWTQGNPLWTREISSYTGIAATPQQVFVTDAKSHVHAFHASNGHLDWEQLQLEHRVITGPAIMGNTLVVGDQEGYLHWISQQDGHFIARAHLGGSGIFANPVVDHGILYVVTRNGKLAAYSLSS